jgi:serine O-acetyltransferase
MSRSIRPISADPDTFGELLGLLREDWAAHSPRPLSMPGFHALALHRFGYWQRRLPPRPRLAARVLHDALYYVTRVFYGIELPRTTKVGRRVVIGHQGGIVIGTQAEIGDDCLIRQNVTIGGASRGGADPRIGKRVRIGAGAVIVGEIVVGDDVVIGPNAVVNVDVPRGARVVAPPARIFPAGAPEQRRSTDESTVGGPSAAEVLALVKEVVQLPPAAKADTPLVSSGFVDSLRLTVLVTAIEERFDVVIESDHVSIEDFDTAAQIALLVANLRKTSRQ